jgi:hypothetical protein
VVRPRLRILPQGRTSREGGRPIAACATRKDAEARRAALEAEARASLNPFAFFEAGPHWLADYSSLSLDEFEKRLRKLLPGIRLPRRDKYGERPWLTWWNGIVDRQTDKQRSAVWSLLDRLHFYAVVPTKLEES